MRRRKLIRSMASAGTVGALTAVTSAGSATASSAVDVDDEFPITEVDQEEVSASLNDDGYRGIGSTVDHLGSPSENVHRFQVLATGYDTQDATVASIEGHGVEIDTTEDYVICPSDGCEWPDVSFLVGEGRYGIYPLDSGEGLIDDVADGVVDLSGALAQELVPGLGLLLTTGSVADDLQRTGGGGAFDNVDTSDGYAEWSRNFCPDPILGWEPTCRNDRVDEVYHYFEFEVQLDNSPSFAVANVDVTNFLDSDPGIDDSSDQTHETVSSFRIERDGSDASIEIQ